MNKIEASKIENLKEILELELKCKINTMKNSLEKLKGKFAQAEESVNLKLGQQIIKSEGQR